MNIHNFVDLFTYCLGLCSFVIVAQKQMLNAREKDLICGIVY